MVKMKQGTYTGTGSKFLINMNLGFEPDVVIIYPTTQADSANLRGTTGGVLVKNEYTILLAHVGNDAGKPNVYISVVGEGQDPYCADNSGAYVLYGVYNDGVFSVAAKIDNANTYSVNGEIYNWEAYKK